MFSLMRMLMVGVPTGRICQCLVECACTWLGSQRGEFVNVYANAYAHGWGPNEKNLSMFRLMRMLVVGVPTGRSCQYLV